MDPLLVNAKKEEEEEEEQEEKKIRWEKLKKVALMAAPMVVVNISQYLIQATSTMIVGHKSEISLAGIALASSIANVTGFSLLFGLAGALETLCGQAFGARQYEKLGSYTFTSIISLLIICFPISLLWIFVKNILLLFHQDPEISEIASVYCLWLIPALFGYAVLQSFIRYFQTQSLIFPMLFSSFTVLCFHIPVCWVLVYTLGLGTKGAALSISISYWLNAGFLWFFMRHSQLCKGKRVLISMEAFAHMRIFFSLAIPSAMMISLEWSAFEIMILISGVLPNSKLETSVITMCLVTSSVHYNFVASIGAATSTNVANEIGAGNSVAAKLSTSVAMIIAVCESLVTSSSLLFASHVWGYAYSNEPEVISYAAEITPFLCMSMVMDSMSGALNGVVRGSGKQNIGAYVNIAAFYIVGIPTGLLFCFVFDFKVKGLWIGIISGCTTQTLTLLLITTLIDWTSEVVKARDKRRLMDGPIVA
ncbi:unnamed protein product [Microthlaspi erraticum]|uniref:Protein DETOXIFICATION n=1 Tax=Microthlaspi erraticum TaxID=1685480 RepID=A0A6D2IQQ0_9BRAS|nr:unnamed protein product [Microthlaspi erraticum]